MIISTEYKSASVRPTSARSLRADRQGTLYIFYNQVVDPSNRLLGRGE
jgi:hypothetical protein